MNAPRKHGPSAIITPSFAKRQEMSKSSGNKFNNLKIADQAALLNADVEEFLKNNTITEIESGVSGEDLTNLVYGKSKILNG